MGGKGLQASLETPPNSERALAFGENRIASVTSVSDGGGTWPAGTIFTYEPGVAGALFLSEGLDSRYEDFFLPGEYRLEIGALAEVLRRGSAANRL